MDICSYVKLKAVSYSFRNVLIHEKHLNDSYFLPKALLEKLDVTKM